MFQFRSKKSPICLLLRHKHTELHTEKIARRLTQSLRKTRKMILIALNQTYIKKKIKQHLNQFYKKLLVNMWLKLGLACIIVSCWFTSHIHMMHPWSCWTRIVWFTRIFCYTPLFFFYFFVCIYKFFLILFILFLILKALFFIRLLNNKKKKSLWTPSPFQFYSDLLERCMYF